MEATRRTREFLGTLMAANAAAIKTHTQEIGDLYTNPVIAMDKITQAHNDLIEAMDMRRPAETGRHQGRQGQHRPVDPVVNRTHAAIRQSAGGEQEAGRERPRLGTIA